MATHTYRSSVTQSSFASPCSKLKDAAGNFTGFDSGLSAPSSCSLSSLVARYLTLLFERSLPVIDPATRTFNYTVSSLDPVWTYCRQGLGTATGEATSLLPPPSLLRLTSPAPLLLLSVPHRTLRPRHDLGHQSSQRWINDLRQVQGPRQSVLQRDL